MDDGLRVLPEILLSKGEVNGDMLNFAVSPEKYVTTIVHCQSLIPNENMCDKQALHTIYGVHSVETILY